MLQFFDANCMLGKSGFAIELGLNGTAAVLDEVARNGIGAILAYHAIAREWDPLRGNALLRPVMHADDRVTGCWVAEPVEAYRPGAAAKQVATLLQHGFSCVRLFPDVGAHNYDLSGRGVRMLLAACAERRVPVFIDTEAPDWVAIDAVLRQQPELPLILAGISYRRSRNLYALLEDHPGLHVESATFVPHRGLEDVRGEIWDRALAVQHEIADLFGRCRSRPHPFGGSPGSR